MLLAQTHLAQPVPNIGRVQRDEALIKVHPGLLVFTFALEDALDLAYAIECLSLDSLGQGKNVRPLD